MNKPIPSYVGQYHDLPVIKEVDFGIYLAAGPHEILMPGRYVPAGTAPGDTLRVFVYRDSEDRLIATTQPPKAVAGQFAALRVVDSSKFGVFLDWGLEKDLFVPFSEQYERMVVGKTYLVRVLVDRETDRVIASARIRDFLNRDTPAFSEGQTVQLLVWEFTQLGIKVVIDESYEGLLYRNEVFRDLQVGDRLPGFIKLIRPDNKIDVTLRKTGLSEINEAQQVLLNQLVAHQGFLPLSDNSTPADIQRMTQMSKKTFKKAVGGLYRDRKIRLEPDGIRLIPEE